MKSNQLKPEERILMDPCVRAAVEAIHSSPTQAVVYLSGGASQALGWLMSVPGASNTVLEAVVPYSRMSMIQLLGKVPAKFASRQTAEDMALLAYNKALKLSQPGMNEGNLNDNLHALYMKSLLQLLNSLPVRHLLSTLNQAGSAVLQQILHGYSALGVGFTGSLASTRPKLGDHRFHVSARTSDRLWVSSVTLSKGLRSREQEETVSSQFFLKAIAHACKVPATFVSELTDKEASDEFEIQFDEDQELEQLINGQISSKVYPFSSDMLEAERKVILPGSFNPLHDGHLKLLEVAVSILGGGYPCFELSAVNADKPPLTVSQIKERVRQFEKVGKTIIISNQPYFYKKAEFFPGSAFVIGADTAARLINPKYYGGDYERMLKTLLGCKNTGCIFLVGGRNVDGVFKILDDFDIPEELKDMFISIPVERFRMDISSTEIRKSREM